MITMLLLMIFADMLRYLRALLLDAFFTFTPMPPLLLSAADTRAAATRLHLLPMLLP